MAARTSERISVGKRARSNSCAARTCSEFVGECLALAFDALAVLVELAQSAEEVCAPGSVLHVQPGSASGTVESAR